MRPYPPVSLITQGTSFETSADTIASCELVVPLDDRVRARIAAAERYEREFVPAAFEESARELADAARVVRGDSVLDVGCGTGVVARECSRRVGAGGRVVGIDISVEMLKVARRTAPSIRWVQGDAGALPFPDAGFDRVLCQFALMLFPERARAVSEMWRILSDSGRLAVSVSGSLEDSSVNLVLAGLIQRQVGAPGLDVVRSVYAMGDPVEIEETFAAAGVEQITIDTQWGTTRSPSLEAFVETEIRGWAPLSELFDDHALEALTQEAREELAFAITGEGRVEFVSPAHIITATKW
jgi:SAM-dependent methyltransferase